MPLFFLCGLSPEQLRIKFRSCSGQKGRDSCFLYIRTTNPFTMRPLHLICAALLFTLLLPACTREVWVNDIEPGVVEIRPAKTFSDSTFFSQVRTMPSVILVGFQNLAYFKTIPSLNDSSVHFSNFLKGLPYMAVLASCYQTPSDSLYQQIFFCNLKYMESTANQNHWTHTLDSLGFRFYHSAGATQIIRVIVPPEQELSQANQLRAIPGVQSANPVLVPKMIEKSDNFLRDFFRNR